MYENEVVKLKKYIDQYLYEPPINWPKYYVDQRRYARWAANEILKQLMSFLPISVTESVYIGNPPAKQIVVDFMAQMDAFSEMSRLERFEDIFVLARDSVEELLYLLE